MFSLSLLSYSFPHTKKKKKSFQIHHSLTSNLPFATPFSTWIMVVGGISHETGQFIHLGRWVFLLKFIRINPNVGMWWWDNMISVWSLEYYMFFLDVGPHHSHYTPPLLVFVKNLLHPSLSIWQTKTIGLICGTIRIFWGLVAQLSCVTSALYSFPPKKKSKFPQLVTIWQFG